jgi:ribosome-binding protein aMBF1 (putative translation factor)
MSHARVSPEESAAKNRQARNQSMLVEKARKRVNKARRELAMAQDALAAAEGELARLNGDLDTGWTSKAKKVS